MKGKRFKYGARSYWIEEDERGVLRVFRNLRQGTVELHGRRAFRVASAYKERVKGEPSVRRPRNFARRPKKYRKR